MACMPKGAAKKGKKKGGKKCGGKKKPCQLTYINSDSSQRT